MSEEIAFAGAAEQARMVREGEASASELVELSLDRIERLDPELNAFRLVLAEQARDAAKAIDRSFKARKPQGRAEKLAREKPLFGVPVAIKDTDDVEGEVTMLGTDAFETPAAADGPMVALLRAAGAIVIGKTHLPELAICGFTESATWGVTRNPWDPQRSPAGSSGGSAAAVAAGMVPIASASDGAGSIRLPAASCGLFGLKPQRGRVGLSGDNDHWHGLSVNGCVSRKVADTALWLDVTLDRSGADGVPDPPMVSLAQAARVDPGQMRIAWSVEPPRALVPPLLREESKRAVADTAELLGSLGHRVQERDPDWGGVGNNLTPRYLRGISTDVAKVEHPDRLERRTRGFAKLGGLIPDYLLQRALREEARDRERVMSLFEENDVLITPVMAGTAIPVRNWEGKGAIATLVGMSRYYPYCVPWNHLGNPAASVPAGFAPDGLPLAVQLIGRPGDEATLLRLAGQLERARPWADRLPAVR